MNKTMMMYGTKYWGTKGQHIKNIGYAATQGEIESEMMIYGTNLG
jgi:hypothetical protein